MLKIPFPQALLMHPPHRTMPRSDPGGRSQSLADGAREMAVL